MQLEQILVFIVLFAAYLDQIYVRHMFYALEFRSEWTSINLSIHCQIHFKIHQVWTGFQFIEVSQSQVYN